MPATRFFPDAHLNVAENLLAGWDGDEPAIIAHDEAGHRRECSGGELAREVAALAAALAGVGVRPGDRVAAWLPNGPEAVIAMLAATVARRGLLVVLARLRRRRRARPLRPDRAGRPRRRRRLPLRRQAPSTASTRLGRDRGRPAHRCGRPSWSPTSTASPDLAGLARRRRLGRAASAAPRPGRAEFARSRSTTPGTSCTPRARPARRSASCTAPAACCCMHLKEHQLHCDIQPGDRVLYFTTTGWMMWNWLVSALASGATLVLYDGSPFVPGADRALRPRRRGGRSPCSASRPSSSTRWPRPDAEPVRHARPAPPAHDLLHRLAAVARGLPLRLRAREGRRPPGLDLGRHRPVRLPRRRRSRPARSTPVRSSGRRWGWPSTSVRRRRDRCRPGRAPASWSAPRRSRRCRSASGTTPSAGRTALPGRLLRALPGRVAPGRLRLVDRARRHRHPRAQRRHAQPRRRPHRHRRDLPASSSS